MAGASIDPIGVVNQIKDNLTDRYDNGFPVLKEIIQNADDAGASSLKIGWSFGFDDAQNELLNAPAIFFINDAPLEEEHRDAILSIAQSSKASSKTSVGKFGLGMKSLFHLGEAFFFMSEQWKEKYWAADVFNPWDKYRSKWNDFNNKDKELIKKKLDTLIGINDKHWFIVWVPLRTSALSQAYNNKMIINNVSDGHALPDFFSEQSLAEKTAKILPQLKYLSDIKIFAESANGIFNELTHVVLDSKSSRSSFNGDELLSNGFSDVSFDGKINATVLGNTQVLEYAGCEKVSRNKRLASLKTEEMGWPKSYQFNKDAQEPIEALDKAEQHSAVTFSRFKTKEQAYLRANWAVFLPLADTDELIAIPIDGNYDYNVYLHGYFFVDAGRKGLHGHDFLGQSVTLDNVKNDEKRLRQVWNIILASEGTFNLVLKALDNFSTIFNLSHKTNTMLTNALHALLSGKPEYLNEVSRAYNWVQHVNIEKREWALLEDKTKCLPIPQPNNDDLSRIWATLPNLEKLTKTNVLYQVCGYEFLTIENQSSGWSESLLLDVLSGGITDIFNKPSYIEYLIQFLNVAKSNLSAITLNSVLFPVFKDVITTISLLDLSLNKGSVAELFSLLSSEMTLVLSIEKEDQALWDLITPIFDNKFVLPKFLVGERNNHFASLALHELLQLLKVVDAFICENESNLTNEQQKSCEDLIVFVIDEVKSNSDINLGDFYNQCSQLKLFKVDAMGAEQRTKYRSLDELMLLKSKHQLFILAGNLNYGKGLSSELSAVVPATELCFISKNAIEIPELYTGLTACTESACLLLLATYPVLGTKTARLSLLKMFSDDFSTPEQKRGLRYLIHGSNEDDLVSLLWKPNRSTKPVWMKLWKMCQTTELPEWCEIDTEYANILRSQYEDFIGIKEQYYKDIISEYRSALPICDFSEFDNSEAEQILSDIGSVDDKSLWQSMPIHLTINGQRVAISSQCLMNGSADIPIEWDVQLITQSAVSDIAVCQYRWINHGRPSELVDIALSQAMPQNYALFILDQLIAARRNGEDVTFLSDKIKATKWLKISNSFSVASPSEVLSFAINDLPESMCLCLSDETMAYHFSQLDLELNGQNELQEELIRWTVLSKDSICQVLLAEAAKDSNYMLGELSTITDKVIEQIMNFPEITQRFIGWKLLSELVDCGYLNPTENKQWMLCKPVQCNSLFWALEYLANNGGIGCISDIRNALLLAFCRAENSVVILPKLRFRNLENQYVDGNKLVSNVAGVVPSQLIDLDEFSIIEPLLSKTSSAINSEKDQTIVFDGSCADVLCEYFESWEGRIPKDVIATFMTLFSKHESVQQLIDGYLRQTTLDAIKEKYQRKWDPVSRYRGPFSGHRFNSLCQNFDFSLFICSENSAFMTSIFGKKVEVSLLENPDSLLIYQKSHEKTKKIGLRTIDPKNVDKDRLIRLLARAVETIFLDIFGVSLRFESDFIKDFGHSEQMDIRVTRQIILDGLVALLQRLQVREEGLEALQLEYAREKKVLVMAEPSVQQDRSRINKVLKKIQDVMENNNKVQQLAINGVRKEISKHFQYSQYSVPFELFQNADDSLSELSEMLGEGSELISRFDVSLAADKTLNFYHWGREVNYCTSSYALGKNRFDRDLEKMVSLNVSDKVEGTTGKFGLGFKSSLLLTDTPRIVSGDICTEIQAGLLPSIPAKNLMAELNATAEHHSINGKVPTLIQLPMCHVSNTDLAAVLGRFQANAGLLTLFSRHIREINVNGTRFEWNGKQLPCLLSLSVGDVKLPTNRSNENNVTLRSTKVLAIKTSSGQFVFAIGSKGFESLEEKKNLSSFWVLNPIGDDLKLGFCINAQFAVDIGRSQLAIDNVENVELAKNLGRELAEVFADMFILSKNDWDTFAQDLGLSENVSFSRFWHSMWRVLTTQWPLRIGDINAKAELIKSMFTCSNGLLDFYINHEAVPSQLGSDENQLVSLRQVSKGAGKLLTEAFSELKEHPKLHHWNTESCLVGKDIFDVLKVLEYKQGDKELEEYDLINLIDGDFPINQITPEKANFYGRFFGKDFEQKMSHFKASVTEKRALEERLSKMSFQNEIGGYTKPSKLLVPDEREYKWLSSFAPQHAMLSKKYNKFGMQLVTLSRLDAEHDLHDWCKRISSVEQSKGGKQDGVCKYLVKGSLATDLLKALKSDHPKFLEKGVFDPNLLTKQWGWDDAKASKFIGLWLDTEVDKARHVKNAQKEFIPNVSDTDLVFKNIVLWWDEHRDQSLIEYDKNLYAQPMPWSLMAEDYALEQLETRKGWLKLFYLGCCQTLGFANDAANRNVVAWFEANGWWDKLAEVDGPSASIWKELMEEYLQTARVDERYRVWIQILPLYRFSTKLQDYVELFMGASFITNLDDLRKPNSSPLLSGTGIQVSELKGTLGIGINFILRELQRHQVLESEHGSIVKKYGFVLPARLRQLLIKVGANLINEANPDNSELVFNYLSASLDNESQHLLSDFDIPFRILLDNDRAFKRCFDFESVEEVYA